MKLSKEEKLQEIKSALESLSTSLWEDANTYHSEWLDRILADLESFITEDT
jgi:hypothetical protein